MARRGGWIPSKPWIVLAAVLAIGGPAAVPQLAGHLGKPSTGHGVHVPQVIQDRLPSLPSTAKGGKYAPGVCHSNDEAPATDAQIDRWITAAGVLLHRPYSTVERRIVHIAIDHESGGKVHAINCWDHNYTDLHTPSMGLMQAIAPTYAAHAPAACRPRGPPGIYDPPCNIAACTDYAIGRYGSIEAIPGARRVQAGDDYIGY